MGRDEMERGGLLQEAAPEPAKQHRSLICTGVGALFYALCNVAISQTTGRVPNDLLLLFRFGGLFLGSGLATLVVGRDATQQRSRGTTFWLVFAGTVSWCINVFFFEALKHAPPGVATAIVYVYPLLGAVGAACFLGEPLPVHAAFTGPAALFGLVVCVLGWPPGSGTTEGGVEPVGVLWSLLIAWSVSCFVLCQRVLSGRGDNPGALTGVRLNATLGLFVLSPLYVAVARYASAAPPALYVTTLAGRDYAWLAIMSLATNLGLGLQTYGFQTAASLESVALVTYVEVPFGYALQLLILKEAPTAYQCVGSAVIVCACAAHTLLDTKKAH